MFTGAVELDAQGFAAFILRFGSQFGLEDSIDEGGDGHHEEFENDHRRFLSTVGLPQPDMCVVFRSPVPPAGASDVVGRLSTREIEKLTGRFLAQVLLTLGSHGHVCSAKLGWLT